MDVYSSRKLESLFALNENELEIATKNEGHFKEIFEHYASYRSELEDDMEFLLKRITRCPAVHSSKSRLKDPYGLIRKIVLKMMEDPARVIHPGNYREQITDLAGIRLLHLVKEDWVEIHRWLSNDERFTIHEGPTANIRRGDNDELYLEHGCTIGPRAAYRSVHYVIRSNKELIELQARTLMEEAWSEIDHRLKYSQEKSGNSSEPMLDELLKILNRLTGGADELASYTFELSRHLEEAVAGRAELLALVNKDSATSLPNSGESPDDSNELQEVLSKIVQDIPQVALSPKVSSLLRNWIVHASSSIPKFEIAIARNHLVACKANLKNIQTALEMWSTENEGKYPQTLDELVPDFLLEIPKCPAAKSDSYSSGYYREDYFFEVRCSGHNHASAGLKSDYPLVNSTEGLFERPS